MVTLGPNRITETAAALVLLDLPTRNSTIALVRTPRDRYLAQVL